MVKKIRDITGRTNVNFVDHRKSRLGQHGLDTAHNSVGDH